MSNLEFLLVFLLAFMVARAPLEAASASLSKRDADQNIQSSDGSDSPAANDVQMVVVGQVGDTKESEDDEKSGEYSSQTTNTNKRGFISHQREEKQRKKSNINSNQPLQIIKINDLEISKGKLKAGNVLMV